MNTKRFLLAVVVVFIVHQALGYLIHQVLLMGLYEQTENLWRPAAEIKHGIMILNGLIWAFLFVCIFAKGYEGKGLMEGIRYGFWIGLLISIPFAYDTYAVMPIPYSLALSWFIYSTIQIIISGAVAALLYKKE